MTEPKAVKGEKEGENKYADRLSKRLCYLLRYGAVREGLMVHENGRYTALNVFYF